MLFIYVLTLSSWRTSSENENEDEQNIEKEELKSEGNTKHLCYSLSQKQTHVSATGKLIEYLLVISFFMNDVIHSTNSNDINNNDHKIDNAS